MAIFLPPTCSSARTGRRLHRERPDLSLGTRGALNFDLTIEAREGGHHSGNWGGLLSDPGIELAHAIASITGPTGQIRIPEWVPAELPANVRRVLAGVEPGGDPGTPAIDRDWGKPGSRPPSAFSAGAPFPCSPTPAARRKRR